MSNTERPRAKLRNRNRIRARPATPEDVLENHLQKLLEEQEILHNLLISHRPAIKVQLQDLGGESNYEFDTQDEEGYEENQLKDVGEDFSDPPKFEDLQQENVILAEDVEEDFSDPPILPPRMYARCKNHIASAIPLPVLVGKCTAPKVDGQGYDPPFLYPDFIAKNETSRVKYNFTLVDSLVQQMKRFLKLNDHSVGEGAKKKRPTGTVPKPKTQNQFKIDQVGHAKYTITVKPRLKEPKQHNQSKNHRLAKSKMPKTKPEIDPDVDLDLDCEFGMEHIEKFRANTVGDEKPGTSGSIKKVQDKPTEDAEGPEKKEEEVVKKEPKLGPTLRSRPSRNMMKEYSYQAILEAGLNKNRKKQLREEKRCGNVTPRPSTPSTRPCTPTEEPDAPKTSKHSTFYELFAAQLSPREVERSHLTPWRLLQARGKLLNVFITHLDKPNPVITGPPPLMEWQRKIVRYVRKYKRKTRRLQRQKEGDKNGKGPVKKREPKTLLEKILGRKKKARRELLHRHYQKYVPVKWKKRSQRLYKAYKRQKEWFRAGREYKRIMYLKIFRPYDLHKAKLTKRQKYAQWLRFFNTRVMKTVKPRKFPRVVIPEMAAEEEWSDDEEEEDSDASPRPMDKGQRLKNLLMESIRLKRQEKLHHLVLPEDPLKAVCLPLIERRKSLVDYTEKEKDPLEEPEDESNNHEIVLIDNLDSARTFYSTSTHIEPPPSNISRSIATVSTLFYAAKQPPQMEAKQPPQIEAKEPTQIEAKELTEDQPPVGIKMEKIVKRKRGKNSCCHSRKITKIRLPDEKSEFRRYFDLDGFSLDILKRMSIMKPAEGKQPIEENVRISNYLTHFYWQRLRSDDLYFHWPVIEGFYPTHYLTKLKELKDLEVQTNDQLDEEIMDYIERMNKAVREGDEKPIVLTCQMAHLMVTSYFCVLYHRATSERRPVEERSLLRCRIAISVVELYQQELGYGWRKGVRVNCLALMRWAGRHETRVRLIYEEPLVNAEERSTIETFLVMRTPNLECLDEFYERRVLPRPDALAINPLFKQIRRYPLNPEIRKRCRFAKRLHKFPCPIEGCQKVVSSRLVMSHFLSDHCRRLQELWLTDRMVLMLYPSCYPPEQIYCICVLALLVRMPAKKAPIPRTILNEQLPSKYLYFAEHAPCFLMFTQVERSTIEGKPAPDPEPYNRDTLYVFWLASADSHLKNVACRVYIYCQDRSVKGNSLLSFVSMSKFKSVAHLVKNHSDSYLAIDYATMATLTKDFKELVFIEVRYLNKMVEYEDSNDETFDV
ncbi:hypothetical protein KR084_000915 [Drosophila pseudotakahashii]|nr:hypothetical protein KR084_000915 [Drosophila pseudotakahashii]